MELIKGKLYLPTAFSRKDSGIKIDQNGLADTVAYCAQQAWLLNDTVKNNILFGSELMRSGTMLLSMYALWRGY